MSTEARRLALQLRLLTRQAGRPVLLVFGLAPGAGVTSVVRAAAEGLRREGDEVAIVPVAAVASAPSSSPVTITLVDGGALLEGAGPRLDDAWRPHIAGVVLVVVADEDRLAAIDEARALLAVLEVPALAMVFNERARVPVGIALWAWWSALRAGIASRFSRRPQSVEVGA